MSQADRRREDLRSKLISLPHEALLDLAILGCEANDKLKTHADALLASRDTAAEYVFSFDLTTNKCHYSPPVAGVSTVCAEEVSRVLKSLDDEEYLRAHVLAITNAEAMIRDKVTPLDLVPHASSLAAKLEHPWVGMRKFGALCLGFLPAAELVPHVASLLTKMDDAANEVRLSVVHTLGQLMPADLQQHAGIVARVADVDADSKVREAAIWTLQKLPSEAFALHA